MKRFLIAMILLAGIAFQGEAQTYQRKARTKITNAIVNGNTYSFDIWARNDSTGTSFFVGISSFYFSYNTSGLANPTLSNINPKYTGTLGVDNYDPMTVAIISGKIAVTIRWTGNATGGGSQLVTATPDTNGERICTISMQITDPNQNASLSWDVLNSALLTTSSFNVYQSFLGADNSPLPVQLATFFAHVVSTGVVELKWRTLTETNNYGFFVQRSQGTPDNYQTISELIPGHGTTLEPHDYRWTDTDFQSGLWYYRLRQVDIDGSEHFSEGITPTDITSVGERPLPKEFGLSQNFPNPFNPSTRIDYAVPRRSNVQLQVYNLLGQRVATLVDEVKAEGYHTVVLDASTMSSGLYFYSMTADGNVRFLRKMVLMK